MASLIETEARGKTRADYAAMQRAYYDDRAVTREGAERLVHPDYAGASRQAAAMQAHALLELALRSYPIAAATDNVRDAMSRASCVPTTTRALDFGCGIGRLMAPLAEAGYQVDGVDISQRMLDLASEHPSLKHSRFFLSNGTDCGDAPAHSYDLVYSYLCVQHICSRTVRKDILSAFARALKPGGMALVQVHFYPERLASTVPLPHVPWSADHFAAAATNSEADVWATPDELPLVYEDFARHFEDVRMQFVNFPVTTHLFTEAYRSRFAHLIVSGSTSHALGSRIYPPPRSASAARPFDATS